jgi:hypothetical protein
MVGSVDIAGQVINVSVDSTQETIWEPKSSEACLELPDQWIYMFGPSKTTIQLTAYPFARGEDYMLGFTCPVNINVSVPWKYIYDCRTCYDCFKKDGSRYKRRGGWKGIPMKKRQVAITGDITGSPIFIPAGCSMPAVKYTLQAGPQPVVIPQETMQYRSLKYLGLPIQFDTDLLETPFKLTVGGGPNCTSIPKIEIADAYLTSFTFGITPPREPSVTYSFDVMTGYCPPDC